MGMNVSSGTEPDVMVDINTTPLIDVMLVLLIMLIITIPIQMHAVKMNLPVGDAPPATQPEIVQIDVAADGAASWNGARLPDRATLEAKLAQVAAEPVQAEIRLRPDRQAPYRDVAAVLASAQRVGATKIGLMGNEQYMQ
ncbi:biopolymer transporter ExbD [Burkholderia aenigmatica]|uniref:Biopolymer transporter ExbD n=1 Tax=Burkholderia aenigmatica TaxID=2015348 RepID=A0A6J5ITM8_9BURK|nr:MULTISPECIES: biopolymer transporter ExbD [Burkholderia]AYQ41311.1 biopolymer transporter ExbD [Burkholderia lata]MCA8293694.1 biopolymer transporter ExbD [Burkholderia sp. AU30198]UKD16261.1 biopolymer transporter ExbD [Burkholderia aenigmatica]CAB3961172.1 biopolymer transporter ExbD [Burkholderia aenigmatica]VWC50658.1 biopolymer transporter ExbD [Burkholderia aenigmatica]